MGQQGDVDALIHDLMYLGFNILHTNERTSNCEINGRKFSMHSFRVKCLSTSLFLLLRALGVPEGNKTNSSYLISRWIKDGEMAIKKEFLAAYLGGDGPKIQVKSLTRAEGGQYNHVNINDIEFHKRTDLIENGLAFAEELKEMLNEFGIVSKVFYETDSYVRRDKTRSAIVHISIPSNFNHAFILAQRIGYTYCWQKQLSAMHSGEFLRMILTKREEWKELHRKALHLAEQGKTHQEIADTLNIEKLLVYQWVTKKVNPTVAKHHILFDSWVKEATEGLKDGFLWLGVRQVEEAFLPEVQVITTEENHNFVANGFLVHNCGPCKMMEPHFKKAADKFTKIKFGKVNVDKESDLAGRFNVMSIPTTVFFKNGEMVDSHTGGMGFEAIERLVKDNFS